MKLTDIFEFVPALNEVFNTKIPVELWYKDANKLVGDLKIDDKVFRIKIDPLTMDLDGTKIYNGANIAFYAIIDDKEVEELTFDNKTGSKILGAISNAIQDEIIKYKLDFILFVATNASDKRNRIYERIASYKIKSLGFKMVNSHKTKSGDFVTIVVKNGIDESIIYKYICTANL